MARVLLVEDNPANRRLFQMVLQSMGHEVVCTASGEEGWAALVSEESARIDMVLLDMHLPGLDGFTLAPRIKERFGREMRVVAITALAMEGDRQRILDSGCDECITKPISVAEFRARMAELLGG